MLSINYPRTYAQTGEHAAYRPVRRPARDAEISVVDGKLALGGVRHPLFFAVLGEAGALCKVDAEMTATIRRLIADGYNALNLSVLTNKKWTDSSYQWGVWKYDATDVSYANRWEMEEAGLAQLDKMIAWSLDAGIECIYISLEGYDQILQRHPNERPLGTYQGRGMLWSSEYRQMEWDVNSRIFLRTSTVTGIRHCDNRRVIWKFRNENGFGDTYTRSTTNAWGGGGSVHWLDKIIEGTTDTYGDNGYWYTELCEKLTAWRAAYAPSWEIPAWGRGSTGVADGVVGAPKRSTWYNWATGADPASDRARMIDFIDQMDYEAAVDLIERCRAEAPGCVLNIGTFIYQSPRASLALPATLLANTLTETHQYFPDNTGVGVRTGSAVTRRSIMDPTWSVVTDGSGWGASLAGTRSQSTALVASECGQYGPNRWRYQRLYYEMVLALLHGYDIAELLQAFQYAANQYTTDGRYMQSDHVNVASPCARLVSRAVSVALRLQFLTEHDDSFIIQSRQSDVAAVQYANKIVGMHGMRLNASYSSDGTENAVWGTRKLYWQIDDALTPTSDWTDAKVSDASIAAGVMVRNTATEKVWVKRPEGVQLMTPYMCGFIDTLREKAAADAIFAMPLYLSSMAAGVTCAVCFLRSDGLWPLFTGPMKLFIHGSDFGDEVVLQGSDYAQHAADALGLHDPPGATYFMANDQVTVYYSASNSQSWGNGSGSAATSKLMMPESFTLHLDTSGMGKTDLEIFGVTKDGIPVRLPSTYDSGTGIWSFNYTGAYPEYTVQPKVQASVRARSIGL